MLNTDLEGLIEAIYTAALNREQWPHILTQIGHALAGASGAIGIYEVTGGTVWERITRLTPECVFRLKNRIPPADEYPAVMPLSQGLLQEVSLTLIQHPSFTAVLRFIRPTDRGLYTQEELHLLRRLTPHLRRALEIDQRLEAARARLNGLEALLNSLSVATLLLDNSTRLLYVNTAAEELLSRKDGLRIRANHLLACQRDCNTALQGILIKATQLSVSLPAAISIHRPGGLRPYVALAIAYPRLYSSLAWLEVEPAAMLFISDPDAAFCPEGEILQMLYGLTRTEAHLATLLASGKKLQEIAGTLHISLNTVKTHLKNIFSKTRTCRQAELIQLCLTVLSGIAPSLS